MAEKPPLWKRLVRPFVTNDVETGRDDWYPELAPRQYDAEPAEVLSAVESVIRERERWSVSRVDGERGLVEAEVRTKTVQFVDDLSVEVTAEDGRTGVSAHSRSRVGRGDLGQNARTIREFFERLDTRLGAPAGPTRA